MAIISYINNFSCCSSEGQLNILLDYVNHKKWTYKNNFKNYEFKQVDILISKNQALQILYLKQHAYKSSQIRKLTKSPHEQPYSTVLTLTQQLTHLITGQPS